MPGEGWSFRRRPVILLVASCLGIFMSTAADDECPSVRSAAAAPGTKDILDGLALDPDAAWERLVRRVESKLRVLVHFRSPWRLHDVHGEEDVLQEVWAEAARSIHAFEYRGPGSLQRWFAGILTNKLLHAGREARRRPIPVSDVGTQGRDARAGRTLELGDACEQRPGVSEHARRRELEARVRAVLQRLPESEREAILLRLFEGLSGREAARRMGVDESTISVRFKRAIGTCAVHLREFAP